jgi:hypothetical protein
MKPTEHVSVPALALRAAPGTLGCSLQPRRPVRNALWPSGPARLRRSRPLLYGDGRLRMYTSVN